MERCPVDSTHPSPRANSAATTESESTSDQPGSGSWPGARGPRAASHSSSTHSHPAHSSYLCTAIPARTNTASYSEAASAPSSARTCSMPRQANSRSNPEANGTPSGTPTTNHAESSRSSPKADSSTSSTNWPPRSKALAPRHPTFPRSTPATASSSGSTACHDSAPSITSNTPFSPRTQRHDHQPTYPRPREEPYASVSRASLGCASRRRAISHKQVFHARLPLPAYQGTGLRALVCADSATSATPTPLRGGGHGRLGCAHRATQVTQRRGAGLEIGKGGLCRVVSLATECSAWRSAKKGRLAHRRSDPRALGPARCAAVRSLAQ
jgi:hypothetical protein